MKRSARSIISLVMTAVYLLVILAPLAPAVLHSAMLAHVLTGECTGDCRSCGCSPERTATRACCCWQKKLAGANALKPPTEHNSCPTSTATAYTKKSGSCCSKPAQHSDYENQTSGPMQATSTTDSSAQTVSISICPCGSGKDMSVASGKTIQHIPFSFSSGLPLRLVSRLDFLQPERFASRYGEPPDPPPKAYISS